MHKQGRTVKAEVNYTEAAPNASEALVFSKSDLEIQELELKIAAANREAKWFYLETARKFIQIAAWSIGSVIGILTIYAWFTQTEAPSIKQPTNTPPLIQESSEQPLTAPERTEK